MSELNPYDRLYKEYPELYKDVYFAVGPGWYSILEELSKRIVKYCTDNNMPTPIVTQIKEKFGGLRYYVDIQYLDSPADDLNGWTTISNFIYDAEEKSLNTCEECGKRGTVRHGSWIKVLCDDCQTNKNRWTNEQ